MSNTNGANSLARSMNGIITIDDGAGTVIQNGTITTNELALNKISAEYPTKDCEIWSNNTGAAYYSAYATGPVYFALGSTSNVNLGPIATMPSSGNVNIGTSSAFTGLINLGAVSATGSRIKLLSPIVECSSVPTIANSVVNKTYADGLITSFTNFLLARTNIWTGVSNTFNNVIYTSLISPITTILSLGSATAVNTLIQISEALVIGGSPSYYNSVNGTLPNNGMRFWNGSLISKLDFFSSGLAGNNYPSSCIQSYNGTAVANSGSLSIKSGDITITSSIGDVNITAPAGQINLTASTAGSVIIEGFAINGNDIQPYPSVPGTFNFCTNNIAIIYIGGPSATVNLAGTAYSSHEFTAGGGIAKHDFHSCSNTNTNDYDGQIVSTGGTVGTVGKGDMQYTGASHKFAGGGISFDKGNLTNGSFIQTFSTLTGVAIGATSTFSNWNIPFTSVGLVAFGTVPIATISLYTSTVNSLGVIISITAISKTSITMSAYNAKATIAAANTWGISFIGIGGY